MLEKIISDNESILEAFCKICEVPLTFFDNDGDIKWECNSEKRICNFFDVYRLKNSVCTLNLNDATNSASMLGEPYTFNCKAGFVNIAISLIIRGEIIGCFIVGPLVMGKISEETISNIFTINDFNQHPEKISSLTNYLRTMKVHDPMEISHISILLNSTVMSAIIPNMDYIKINDTYKRMTSPEPNETLFNDPKKEKKATLVGGGPNIINQAAQIIKEDFMHKISLEKVAAKLYISQSYLSMLFKHEMGVTFTDYLNDARIKSSKELLAGTNISLMEVSISSGFEDQSYFTKVFKKIEGCTPREFRQKNSRKL